MCKFMSSFSKHSPEIIGAKKRNQNLEMFLQPCKDEKTYYRVRLLAFGSSSGRTDPHITRMVHSAWVTDEKTGKHRLEKVVCSRGTPWVETVGAKESSCKICNHASQLFSIYNESGKTDIATRQKAYRCKPTFEAIVPVYVINDPNYERNNGKFKVIIFNDQQVYKEFRNKCDKKNNEVPVLNGGKAVDCVLHVAQITETSKSGKPFKKTVIDKIKFSTEPKEIPAINSTNIDNFPFDDTYYVSSDDEEIEAFYNAHCAISNDDIPEDDDIPVYKPEIKKEPKPVKIPSNDISKESSSSSNADDIPEDDLDELIEDKEDNAKSVSNDLATDPDEEGLVENKSSDDISDDEDFLKELGI